jgi:predicted nucleic acid-binding protein
MEINNRQISPIADTSGLVSLIIDTDENNERALKISKQLRNKKELIIIPEDIYAETINLLGKKFNKNVALETGTFLLNEPAFIISTTNYMIRKHALKIFSTTASSVSFTDCLVMAFADIYETPYIFGFDKIFAQKGYQLPTEE